MKFCIVVFNVSSYFSLFLIYFYLGECRILNSDYVELKGVLCQSFAALQDREVLLKYALGETN